MPDSETEKVTVDSSTTKSGATIPVMQSSVAGAEEVPQEESAPFSFSSWLGSPSVTQSNLGNNYSDEAAQAGFKTSKYDTEYTPGKDLQQNRALEQSGFAKIMTGLGKGVVTAGATAVNTTIGTVWGLGSALFESGKILTSGGGGVMDVLDAGTNNFISQQMINLQNWSEKVMPNYRTQEERSEKYQSEWYKHIFTANFIGDSLLKNFGFTVGAMGGARVWTKLIGAAMSSKLMNDVMRGVAVASNGDEVATAELSRAMQALQRGNIVRVDADKLVANIKNVGRRLNSANARLQLYGAALGAVGEGTTEGLMAKNEFLEDYTARMNNRWATEYKDLENDLIQSGNPAYVKTEAVQMQDGTLYDVPMLTETGKQELARRQQELTRKYEDMSKYAAEQGERLAATTMLLNLPILTTSNTIQFGRMLAGGWKNQRSLARATGKLGSVKPKGTVAGRTILNSLKVAASEGSEEMLQGTVSSGAKQVADYRLAAFNDAGYDDEAVHSVRSWFENMATGGKDYLADKKNWQEGFLGAITGLLGIPGRRWGGGVIGSYQEAKQELKAERDAANELNKLVNSADFQNRWRGYIRHLKYDNDMSKATVADDRYAYHTASDNQLINDVITFAQAGRLDDLREQVSNFREVAARDVDDIRSMLKTSDDPQMKSFAENASDKEITDAVHQKADTILTAIDEYKDIYDALASRAPADATPEFLSELVFTAQQVKAMDRRFLSLLDKTLRGDGTTPGVDTVLETLAAVKTGKDASDPETRRTFELMRDTYERAFGNFLVPSAISPAMQTLIDQSLDELESVTGGIDGLNKNVKDLRKMSEARRELYGKLETLQSPAGVESFTEEATTQERVEQAAEEVAIQQETQNLTSLAAVKDEYLSKRTEADRLSYINTLRTAANSNSNIKAFLELKQLYDGFKSFALNKPAAYPDITVTPPMIASAINDALMLANTRDEFANLPDNVFKTQAEFDAANKTPFGVPSPTAYNSIKKILRDWMHEYLQLDSDTASRRTKHKPEAAPVTPLDEQMTPLSRDASQPGSALPLPVKPAAAPTGTPAAKKADEHSSEVPPAQQLAFNTVLKMLANSGISVGVVNEKQAAQVLWNAGFQFWIDKGNTNVEVVKGEAKGNVSVVDRKVQAGSVADKRGDNERSSTSNAKTGIEPLIAHGEIYGYVADGKIYLVKDKLNPATPIHEYTHLWDNACRIKNPELWERGVELMKQTSLWGEIKADPNYAGLDENGIASEVHARLTGRNGKIQLEKLSSEVLEKNGGKIDDTASSHLTEALRDWLQQFWYWFRETFVPWSDQHTLINLDEFINMPISSLVKGESISEMKPAEKPTEERLADEAALAGSSYQPSYLEEQAGSVDDSGESGAAGIPYLRTGMPEIDSEQAALARRAMDTGNGADLRNADLSDFPVRHPEYATMWNALAARGAFDNVANVRVGDEIEFVIDRTFPQYNGEYQILMTTIKNGKRKVLSVLPRNNRRSKYLNMDSLREAIDSEYTEFLKTHSVNELFVFSKTSKVWATQPGFIDYGFEKDYMSEQPIVTANSYSEDAPIVFINREGKPIVVRGDDITAGERMGNAFQDAEDNKRQRRVGNLYYLVRMTDKHYIPVRLGVEHLSEDELNKATTSALRQAAVISIGRLTNIVQETTNLNLEEQNKKLHTEIATLSKSLSLYGVFFELGEYDNVGVALRVNNNKISKLIRPGQIKSTEQLIKFLAQFDLSYQIRQPEDPAHPGKYLSQITNLNDLIDEGLITTNATKLRMKGTDFYCFAWDSKSGDFAPVTNAQVALNEQLDREAIAAAEVTAKTTNNTVMPNSVEDFKVDDDNPFASIDEGQAVEQPTSAAEKPLTDDGTLVSGNNGSSSATNDSIAMYAVYPFAQLPIDIQATLREKGYTEEEYGRMSRVMRERALACK